MIKDRKLALFSMLTLLAIFSGSYTFWWYSGLRAMRAVLGFNLNEALLYTALSLSFLLPIIAITIGVLLIFFTKSIRWYLGVIVILSGGLTGIALGETSMLIDEAVFRHQVEQAESAGLDHYARARAWPNRGTSLIWWSDSGIHATD